MRHRWAPAILAVAIVLATASCQFSLNPFRSSSTTVKELARKLARPGDDVALVEEKLLAANGGHSALDANIAAELVAKPAVLDDIRNASGDIRNLACKAWTSGAKVINSDAGAASSFEAQRLLDEMHADTSEGKAAVGSVTMACELADALSEW